MTMATRLTAAAQKRAGFSAGKILSRYHADLRPDDCAGVHNQGDQNIHVALDCVK